MRKLLRQRKLRNPKEGHWEETTREKEREGLETEPKSILLTDQARDQEKKSLARKSSLTDPILAKEHM